MTKPQHSTASQLDEQGEVFRHVARFDRVDADFFQRERELGA
jgi:hypothetical protein